MNESETRGQERLNKGYELRRSLHQGAPKSSTIGGGSILIPEPCSLLLQCGPHRLLLVGIELCVGRMDIRLPIHPFVEARALEAPPVAQLEGWNETFRGEFVEGVGRNTKVVRVRANIHDLANFRNKQIGAGSGVTHNSPP